MTEPRLPRITDAPSAPKPEQGTASAEPKAPDRPRETAAPAGSPERMSPAPAAADTPPARPEPEARMPRGGSLFAPHLSFASLRAGEDGTTPAAAGAASDPVPAAVPPAPVESAPAAPAQARATPEPAQKPRAARPSKDEPPAPGPTPPKDVASLEERLRPRAPLVPIGMSDRARFVVATLCGLVLAAGVHIAIVLAMPRYAANDAFSRLRPTMEEENAVPIAGPGPRDTWMPLPDPAAAVAACAYDLRDGPVRVSAKTGALFQSLSFHARGSGVYFAITDRAAVRGELDLVVMTRRQLDEALAAEDESDPTRDVRIVAPRPEGFVIVRVLAPAPSLRPQAEEAAKAVLCSIEGDEEEPAPPAGSPPPAPPAPPPPAPAPPAAAQPGRPPAPAPAAPVRR